MCSLYINYKYNSILLHNIIYTILLCYFTFYDYSLFFLISAIADLGSISKNKIH